MLLPDQTYEGASPASPAARAPAPLPALLRAHRVRPDFFCANRPRRSRQRDSRKAAAAAAAAEGAGAGAARGELRRRPRHAPRPAPGESRLFTSGLKQLNDRIH
ncbi:uncharacterized protein [Choristoneura fumiferana]|uniref:uncharacterized protein n=1 Tax=Choristoneura fumiferana TaxID=7141 RepID=UPI003D15B2F9